MKRELNLTKIFKTITIIVTIILIIILIYFIQAGIFEDQTKLINYIKQFGLFGVLLFILLQAIQVIFPVIPGGASCLIGVLSFGPILGFIYNYIGLTLGSILAYLLAKTYGLALIRKLFKAQTIDKYLKYLKTSKFNKIFFLCILIPGLPDDLSCYLAGISSMKLPTFIFTILIAKPLSLLMYSIFIILI